MVVVHDVSSAPPPAVVVGVDSITGLQTARILAARGVPVLGVARDPKHFCCRTRVCRRILFTDTTSDALIDLLEDLGATFDQRGVLVPCSDAEVLLISRFRDRLEPAFHVPLPPHHVVETLMDKLRFYRFAQQHGLQIPRTMFLSSADDAERASREMTFPVVLKPPYRTARWRAEGFRKVYRVGAPTEIRPAYERLALAAPELVAQEWVEGPESELYSCNAYFDGAGTPLVTFVSRKIRQWPPGQGISSLGVECRNDTVLGESLRLFRSIPYRGLGYVEMKRNVRTGEHFIIEPNIGRPTARSPIAEAGGVELLYTMYADTVGLPLPTRREQRYRGAKWVYLRFDTQSAFHYFRRRQLTISDWLRSWRGIRSDAVFSWRDPLPFWVDIFTAARKAMAVARGRPVRKKSLRELLRAG
jgi:predicted ATP-grasp superfamily ATP-dependent carboligase